MTKQFQPHMEILPQAQLFLWPQLAPAQRLGYVLYGGTAVALRLGHRQSIDFDFFTDAPLERRSLYQAMPLLNRSRVLQDEPNTLTVLTEATHPTARNVKLSFFGGLNWGRVGCPELTRDSVMLVASPVDLLATKLKVLLQRVESKDYRDVAALLASAASLAQGLGAARALFGNAFQPAEALKALTYFEGGDLKELSAPIRRALESAAGAVREIPPVTITAEQLGEKQQLRRQRNNDYGMEQ